jgi:hypothetical protein
VENYVGITVYNTGNIVRFDYPLSDRVTTPPPIRTVENNSIIPSVHATVTNCDTDLVVVLVGGLLSEDVL